MTIFVVIATICVLVSIFNGFNLCHLGFGNRGKYCHSVFDMTSGKEQARSLLKQLETG